MDFTQKPFLNTMTYVCFSIKNNLSIGTIYLGYILFENQKDNGPTLCTTFKMYLFVLFILDQRNGEIRFDGN